MINLIASVALLFTPVTLEDGVYSNHFNFSYSYHYCDYIQDEGGTNAIFSENDLEFNGYLYFNDGSNYQIGLQNVKLMNHVFIIQPDNDGSVGDIYWDYTLNITPVFTMEDLSHVSVYSTFVQESTTFYYYNAISYPYGSGYLTTTNYQVFEDEDIYLNGTYTNSDLLHSITFNIDTLEQQIQNLVASQGYEVGYGVGYSDGYGSGSRDGYAEGYQNGLTEGANMNGTAITIFNGILSISLVPINFFLGIFNFEVLGINITGFVMALLSVCCVIILIRMLTGKKASGD